MNMQQQRIAKLSFRFGAVILSLLALLFCSVSAIASAEEGPCKGLKPFNNLDELLYQFYINLDSDCLFKMSPTELEKIWGIKILSSERAPIDTFHQLRESCDFYTKPYKSDEDAFYVEIYRDKKIDLNVFYINITKDFYEKHATLFPDGKFPKLLPEPLKIASNKYFNSGSTQYEATRPRNIGKFKLYNFDYYWLNVNQTHMIYLTGFYGVTGVTVKNEVNSAFIK